MKLSNYLTLRLSFVLMLIMLIWSVIYFFIQMAEIHDGIDEGLTNLKQEFIYEANYSPEFLEAVKNHNPLNIRIEQITYEEADDFKETFADSKVYFVTEKEYEEVRMLTTAFYCEQDGNYYKLEFFTSTVERDDLIKNMSYLLIALWLGLALALVLVVKRIIYKSNEPFYTLLSNLKKFRLDNTKMIEFPKTRISEYAELNESVRILLERSIGTFVEQKNFIENASHELQTPLAITINRLELLLDASNLSEQQMNEISSILNNLNRMKRLNSSLLLLSKIKNKQYVTSEEVDLVNVFDITLSNFEDLIEHKGISMEVKKISSSLSVNMNKDLAFILATNLIKNAVSHNVKEGYIEIIYKSDSIVIINEGTPIDEDTDIFKRYVSNTSGSASSGLGLSIVKSIADIYNYRILHHYSGGKHIVTLFVNNIHND